MIAEYNYFIQILRDYLHGEKTLINDGLDWNIIHKIAKHHQVEGIVYYQTKRKDFLQAYSSTIYYSTNRKKLIDELLSEIKVPFFIVKGAEVAQCYPIPELRTMGDTDLVVKDRNAVNAILIDKGYQSDKNKPDWEWHYYKRSMEFELHDRLVYEEAVNDNRNQIVFFNDCWNYLRQGHLDWSFHFLFLIFHLKKHFMNSGVGFRQFMDLGVVIKEKELNWQWIERRLIELDLIRFSRVVFAFLERWFEIKAPIAGSEISEMFYEEATNKIIKDGVFGFTNEMNEGSLIINKTRREGKCAQIKDLLKKVFPSYNALRSVTQYSFVDRKPFLVPIVWGYRILYNKKRIKDSNSYLKSSFVSNEKIEKREQMYKQWGL